MTRVLFVCLGNICRSPMAEGVFRTVAETRGLVPPVEVDSAGTGAWHLGRMLQAFAATHGLVARVFRNEDEGRLWLSSPDEGN